MKRRGFLRLLAAGAVGLAVAPTVAVLPAPPAVDPRIALMKALIARAIAEHDRLLEEALFGDPGPLTPFVGFERV